MEQIEIVGDLITIRDVTFNINDLVSIKPQSLVQFFIPVHGKPRKIREDYPKILVVTKSERHEFAYNSDQERDTALKLLNEKVKVYYGAKTATPSAKSEGSNISINVADSANVNIVNQSSGVKITSKQISDAKQTINELRQELEKYRMERAQEVEDLVEILGDIEKKLDNNEKVPKLTFKSLLETASNMASVSSLAISLGQIIGAIPPLA